MSATLYFQKGEESIKVGSDDLYLNLANRNARLFLSVLGLSTDFENDAPMQVREFEAALLRFKTSEIASVLDTGCETKRIQEPGKILMVDCGLPEGYFAEKVEIALELVGEAIGKGATHCYFI